MSQVGFDMGDDRRRLLREVRRTVLVFNALTLVIGSVLIALAVVLSHASVAPKVFEVAGTALASAALVSFVFGAITIRDTTLQMGLAVNNAMHDTLQPFRDALHSEALGLYRWDCYLDGPADGDSRPDYGHQLIRFSYRMPNVPRELRLVCLASFSDDVLDQYADDVRYIFRWLVDEGMNAKDHEIFQPIHLRIDGQALANPAIRTIESMGKAGAEYRFQVPPALRSLGGHSIDLAISVRKFIGDERRVRIQSQLFRPVTDAEYRLTVGPRISAQMLTVQVSEISPLPGGQVISSGATYPGGRFGNLAGHALFPFMLMKGSTVAFTIERDTKR